VPRGNNGLGLPPRAPDSPRPILRLDTVMAKVYVGSPRPILRLDTVMAKVYVGGKLAPLVHRVKKVYRQFSVVGEAE